MPALPLLADSTRYRPCIQDLLRDGDSVRTYWLDLFERHLETLAALPVNGGRLDDHSRWTGFCADYLAGLSDLRKRPDLRGELTVLELTRFRDEKLADHALGDPFHELKQRENAIAVKQYPFLIRALDGLPDDARIDTLAAGLFAGNLFDMGSRAAVEAFEAGGGDFAQALARVRPRPWPVDELEQWRACMGLHQRCLFFVDNAGPDIVLGVIPFVRELARRGTQVVLAANSAPALNDITASELHELLMDLAQLDSRLRGFIEPKMNATGRGPMIQVVASGCTSPLIDLSEVSAACRAAAADCDLLVLEGMGRAIESNYDARFCVDTLKLALIKDPMVAQVLGVELFDPIFRFEPADRNLP